MLSKILRENLHKSQFWIELRELEREGAFNALRRLSIQQKILKTKPIVTSKTGDKEVRVLTWRRDWLNTIWSLKSFYTFSEVDFPLYIHDGGLKKYQIDILRSHFPQAYFMSIEDSDKLVNSLLEERKLIQCQKYRSIGPFGRRFIDFYILSKASAIITIDADVVFFKKPVELIDSDKINRFNKDASYAYSAPIESLECEFGIKPVSLINAGLSLVWNESMDFQLINECLKSPLLFNEPWLTEQTVHALASTIYGVELLPDNYQLSTNQGLNASTISKHYPSRTPYLYTEGFSRLLTDDFLRD
jgi:hypothetical protein